MEIKLLDSQEINRLPQSIPNWTLKDGKLSRDFDFKNFIEAFGFITKIAILSESLSHHPEWSNVYNKVKIELITHDLNGISTMDVKLAKEIDKLYL